MIVIIMLLILVSGIAALTWELMEEFYDVQIENLRSWFAGFKFDRAKEYNRWVSMLAQPDNALVKPLRGLSRDGLIYRIDGHIRLLLQITLGMGADRSVRVFWILSGLLGVISLFFLFGKISFSLTAISSLLSMCLPYCMLRLKLQKLRVDSSREGEILITELLNNYKISYFNMQKAIEETAKTIEDAPNSKRILFNLSKGLNTADTKERIKFILKEFRLSINTNWGNILANNMYFALASGIEVTEAISDLADVIKKARKIDEYSRRENNEAALILKYLAPVSYFLTVIGAIEYFGLSPEKFLYYQFKTEVGLTWFIISLVIYVAGVLINGYLTRGRLDL